MTANRALDRRGSDAAILLVVSLVAGIAAGTFIYLLQTRFVHLLILYSLVMGAIVGLTMREAVYRWRINAPLAAALIAGLGGATAWATPLAIGYAQYRLALDDDQAAESVPAWIRGEIRAGTTFEKHTDRLVIGSWGTAFIWIVELVFAAGLAAELAYKAQPRAG